MRKIIICFLVVIVSNMLFFLLFIFLFESLFNIVNVYKNFIFRELIRLLILINILDLFITYFIY